MMLDVLPQRSRPDVEAGDDFDHLYCCDPDLAHCGEDISEHEEVDDEELDNPCLLCSVLQGSICPRCGEERPYW